MGFETEIERLTVKLVADASNYMKVLDASVAKTVATANSIVASVQSMTAKVAASMTRMGTMMSVGVTVPLVGIGTQFVKIASDANETRNKLGEVFRSLPKETMSAVNELNTAYGQSIRHASDMLSSVGDLTVGLGFSEKEALRLASSVSKLSVDMSSFKNVPVERALRAITSALVGEREAMKLLGVAILEEDVQQQMALNSAKGLRFETERMAKAQATFDLIMKASQKSVGDYGRTANDLANSSRRLREQFDDLAVELGTTLLPAAQKLVGGVRDLLQWFNELSPATKEMTVTIAAYAAAIGPATLALGLVAGAISKIIALLATFKAGIAALVAGASAVNIVLVGVALALGKVAVEVYSANKSVREYNKALKETIRLNDKLNKMHAAAQQDVLDRAAAIQDPTKRDQFLTEAVADATRELEGMQMQAKMAQAEVDRLDTVWRRWTWNKELEVANVELNNINDALEQQKEHVQALTGMQTKAVAPIKLAVELDVKKREHDLQDVQRMIDDYLTPIEKFQKRKAELNRLMNVGALGDPFSATALQAYGRAMRALNAELADADPFTPVAKALREQIMTFGMGEDAITRYKLAIQGAGAADLAAIKLQQEHLRGLRQQEAMLQRAEDIREANKSPESKLVEVEAELHRLVQQRFITEQLASKELARQRQLLMPVQTAVREIAAQYAGIEGIEEGTAEAFAFMAGQINRANDLAAIAGNREAVLEPHADVKAEVGDAAKADDANWKTQQEQMQELIEAVRQRRPEVAPLNLRPAGVG